MYGAYIYFVEPSLVKSVIVSSSLFSLFGGVRASIPSTTLLPKDHIEKIDFQDHFFPVVNWPSQNCTGHLSAEYATSAILLQAKWRMFSWLRGVC